MSGLDWSALQRAGLRHLRLTPEVFWALTPAELSVMLGHPEKTGPLLSDGLRALMDTYPDQSEMKDKTHDG
ncbi:MAG: rcc01693 family protein [Pseudomonadota bacterium]